VCRHNRSAGDFHQWIEYDLLYVQHLSFWLDLKILIATFLTLGGKAMHIPSSWLVGSRQAVAAADMGYDRDPQQDGLGMGWRTDVATIENQADRGLVA
jgi:hypothetical protein